MKKFTLILATLFLFIGLVDKLSAQTVMKTGGTTSIFPYLAYDDYVGGTLNPTDGKFGGAIYYDLSNNTFSEFVLGTDIKSAGSVSMFVKHSTDTYRRQYLSSEFGNLEIATSGSGVNYSVYASLPGNSLDDASNVKPTTGVWHHIVVTWDETAGDFLLYVDGVLQPGSVSGGTVTGPDFISSAIRIGQRHTTDVSIVRNFNGGIDDLAFYNIVLTPTQISNIGVNGAVNETSGQVALWKFDNAAGVAPIPSDFSIGSTINMMNSGSTELRPYLSFDQYDGARFNPTGGKFNGALFFDTPYGATTLGEIESADFDIKAAGSLSFFVKHDYTGYRQQYISSHGADFEVAMHNSGTIYASTNVDTYTLVGTEISDNNWHHVVVTWDESTSELSCYLDGNLQLTKTGAVGPDFNGNSIRVGQRQDDDEGDIRNLDGGIDDIAFYDKVLSVSEIAQIAAAGAFSSTDGLVAGFKLDDPVGTTSVIAEPLPILGPTITIESPVSSPCGTLEIPVTVKDFTNVANISLVLNYEAAVLEYQSVTIPNATLAAEAFYNAAGGQFIFGRNSSDDEITLGEDEVLFTLHFNILPGATAGSTTDLTWDLTDPANCELSGGGTNPMVYNSTFKSLTGILIPDRPVENTSTGDKYCSIQAAIDDATSGDEISVAAGTYAEDIVVDKALTILGPNANIDPCSGSRGAEAIVVPATAAIASGEIFHVEASDVTIKGFTIDGDNPGLTSGFSSTNGADIDAAEGVTVYVDNVNNLTVENNIFQNLSYYGVTLFGASYSAPATTGHLVSNNKFQNLGTYDSGSGAQFWGGGVLLYNGQYAAVNNNCMTNVRIGIQTGNFHALNPGAAMYQVIDNNTIEARRRGIFYNLHTGNPSPLTLSNNKITALANTNETVWDGILMASLSEASGVVVDNTIDGSGVAVPSEGYEIWNVKSNAPALISGGLVKGVKTGIFLNNFEGYNSDADNGAHATIQNVTIQALETGVRVLDSPGSTNHAPVIVDLTGCNITALLEGVKFEETQPGTIGGTISNNNITASAAGINITSMVTSATNGLDISDNTITMPSQTFLSYPTRGISLTEVTGSEAATISDNNISGAFYAYLVYNLNTVPQTTITGGALTGVMQGVAIVNIDPVSMTMYAPSTLGVSDITMSGFIGNHTTLPSNNFHAGVYVFTGGSNTADVITATIDNVSVTGTGKVQQSCAGLSFSDFSTGSGVRQDITVTNSTVEDNLNRGINIRGANADVEVLKSKILENGSDAFGAGGNNGFGVVVFAGAQATVENCYITNPATSVTDVTALYTFNYSGLGGNLEAHNNSLDQNGNLSNLLAANSGGTLNATCNWWGSTGPIPPLVGGAVTWSPFLDDGGSNETEWFDPTGNCVSCIEMSLSETHVDVTCFEGTNGSIDLTIAGGVAPFTFEWTTLDGAVPASQEDEEDLTGLVAGTYTVVVTDGNLCEQTIDVEIIVADDTPPQITTCPPAISYDGCSTAAITGLVYSTDLVVVTEANFIAAGGVATDDCAITYYAYQDAVATGTCPILVVRTWTLKDGMDNTQTCDQTISVIHTVLPTEVGGPVVSAATVECVDDAVEPTPFPLVQDACANALSPGTPVKNVQFTNTFDEAVTLASSEAEDVWYIDRYAPAGFAIESFDGDMRLKQSILASDHQPGAHENTQGRAYLLGDATTYLEIKLYVPSEWSTTNRRLAGLWGEDVDAAGTRTDGWPIVEFTSEGNNPRFRVWEGNDGWADIGLPQGFTYDSWVTLSIRQLPSGEFLLTAGSLKYVTKLNSPNGSVALKSVILQGYNHESVTYDIYWDDLTWNDTYTAPECEGEITYTYLYEDCAGLPFAWTYTYTIERTTIPSEVGGPVADASTVYSIDDATAPTELPVVEDVCGTVLTPTGPVMSDNISGCTGTRTYTYTYTDCAGLNYPWTYTYNLATSTINGTLVYNNTAKTPMNLVKLIIKDDVGNQVGSEVITSGSGAFEFAGLCAGTYTIQVTDNQKDVGGINSTDAGAVNYWSSTYGTDPIEHVKFLAGDVTKAPAEGETDMPDKFLSSDDALKIQRYFVFKEGFPEATPIWSYWKAGEIINHNDDPYTSEAAWPTEITVEVNGNIPDLELYGQATGDFNGSLVPTTLKSADPSLMLAQDNYLQVGANQEFELPLRAAQSMEVSAISMILELPSGKAEVQDVIVNGSSEPAMWTVNGNELRIGWNSLSPVYVGENESLVTLKLKTGSGFTTGQALDIALPFNPLNELAGGNHEAMDNAALLVARVGNGTVDVFGMEANSNLSFSNYPNPFTKTTTLEYHLPVDGKVTLSIYNNLGQRVSVVVNENQQSGRYSVRYDGALLPGIYVAKLQLSNSDVNLVGTIKLSVAK